MTESIIVKTVEELKDAPEEYREAVSKLVISHAVNELYGAQVFDEPAIAYAPTPYAKWLTCRVAMEEYGHHVRFFFGGSKSRNNDIFRKWNIKQCTNDEMRADFMTRASEVTTKYGLTLPEVRQAA